jgi:hypothetical protein
MYKSSRERGPPVAFFSYHIRQSEPNPFLYMIFMLANTLCMIEILGKWFRDKSMCVCILPHFFQDLNFSQVSSFV